MAFMTFDQLPGRVRKSIHDAIDLLKDVGRTLHRQYSSDSVVVDRKPLHEEVASFAIRNPDSMFSYWQASHDTLRFNYGSAWDALSGQRQSDLEAHHFAREMLMKHTANPGVYEEIDRRLQALLHETQVQAAAMTQAPLSMSLEIQPDWLYPPNMPDKDRKKLEEKVRELMAKREQEPRWEWKPLFPEFNESPYNPPQLDVERKREMAVTTPIGTMSFPHLFTPRKPAENADERFSMVLIFDPATQNSDEYRALKRAVMECAQERWGDKAKDMIANGDIKLPFRDAATKADQYAGYEKDHVFVNAWSTQKPGIVDARLQEILTPDDIWPGQLARATVNPFAYENTGNRGISLGLNNVQICKKDCERLDGRKKATDDFSAVESDDGDTPEGDDDIPF